MVSVECRQAAYRALFEARIDPEQREGIRHATNGNYVLGSTFRGDKAFPCLGHDIAAYKDRGLQGQPP